MPIYDLTIEISPKTIVFPGDPIFSSETLMDVGKGNPYTLRHFHFGNHTGTHIDFPAHVIKGGKCSSDFPLEYLMGKGRIVEISDNGHVTIEHIEEAGIKRDEIVFFKTNNTRQGLHSKAYTKEFVAIEADAARVLAEIGVKIVGIDYLSVDRYEDESLSTHKALLSNDILVIENASLADIPAGEYFISIAPLKVNAADGLPVRITACTESIFGNCTHRKAFEEKEEAIENKQQEIANSFNME